MITTPLPPTPDDNEARLDALKALCILDTEPEQGFDKITAYVANVCGTPVALVSLVDRTRQWFKSNLGLDQPETGLENSVCAYVVYENDFLEIKDLSVDPRTRHMPLVTEPDGVRFYAGAPLRLSDGQIVGALCVLDKTPRQLNDFQRNTLRVMASQVVTQLELRRALEQTELLKREVDHRVKNSLQSISAQTRIHARQSNDPNVKAALKQVQARIEMVAALHEQLCQSSDGVEVDLTAFLTQTGRILEGTSPAHIKVEMDIAPVRLSADQASALGVILNEFASNSFKHAFPNERPGVVKFTSRVESDGSLVLDLEDDGVGMPETVTSKGIGLAVIEASVQQLGGDWSLPTNNSPGTRARLVVPPERVTT
ncbi:MAG TPA: hypothetical protein DEO85_16045 [Maritimibacter sp.]|nr:hypothetical protein [Maritimibacter sp.]